MWQYLTLRSTMGIIIIINSRLGVAADRPVLSRTMEMVIKNTVFLETR